MKLGIVGCGAICDLIVKAIKSKRLNIEKVIFYDKNTEKSMLMSKLLKDSEYVNTLDELVKKDIDIIVECASINAVKEVGEKSLKNNKDLIVMSVGAFADKELYLYLYKLAKERGRKIYIPSGAIAGIDAVKSASLGKVEEVSLTTIKPLKSLEEPLKNMGIDIKNIKEPTTVFEGDVFEAIKKFPQNINVSVVLSIATKTPAKVKIVVDPNRVLNRHEIYIKGEVGCIKTVVENKPSENNPKTSSLAGYSLIQLIKELSEPIKIGT